MNKLSQPEHLSVWIHRKRDDPAGEDSRGKATRYRTHRAPSKWKLSSDPQELKIEILEEEQESWNELFNRPQTDRAGHEISYRTKVVIRLGPAALRRLVSYCVRKNLVRLGPIK